MFPSVRLMIVAISASLLAVLCAMTLFMGMFAAFSIAHAPFSDIAAAKPPLQIALADEISRPSVDGKPVPFGVRFQLKAPQIPKGPVIVPVPATLDRAAPAEIPSPAEPVTNPAANAQANSPQAKAAQTPIGPVIVPAPATLDRAAPAEVRSTAEPVANPAVNAQANSLPAASSVAAPPHDDTQVAPSPSRDAPASGSVQVATNTEDKTSQAKSGGAAGDETAAAAKPAGEPPTPAPQPPAPPSVPQHAAPRIRIVSREADNPASVTTWPAPTLARKVVKRRRVVIHLRVSHRLRRPRVQQTVTGAGYTQASGFVQPNAFGQPGGATYPTGAFGQQNGFMQPGFGFAPVAIKPKPVKVRRAAVSPSANSDTSKNQQQK